ncbi:MAG: chemotaxis protein CheW [Spirochaetaceae bacterium]|nr:MAG: chemotaxis protein CheW [Spirochaetaceae bacterium]
MSSAARDDTNQYLTFTLDRELYAIAVHSVKEVLEYTNVTKVPRTLDFMKGVINLRGSVVPVVDLRTKFGMDEVESTIATSIIVAEVSIADEAVVLGMIADSVQEVINLDPQDIEPPPRIGSRVDSEFIEGIGKQDDRFVIILAIDRVFSEFELAEVASGPKGSA